MTASPNGTLLITVATALGLLASPRASAAPKKCPYDQAVDPSGHCVGLFACPDGMIPIPGVSFTMGKAGAKDDQGPAHKVSLSPYCIDRTEVTAKAYRACMAAGACQAPVYDEARCDALHEERGDHPANCATWDAADGYCRWAGKRLPTEAEWELAARGQDGRSFPWGNAAPSKARVVASLNGRWLTDTASVGSVPQGASPWGALDMSGNVCELVSDYYAEYAADAVTDPKGPASGKLHVCRGGSLNNRDGDAISTTFRRVGYSTGSSDELTGFRCAATPAR